MTRIIVSILSNHSVPNFLFIKEMAGQYDRHIFVTSPEIDNLGRKEQLIKALGITDQNVTVISVDGNDYQSAIATLTDRWQEDEDNEYIVNLTGGTKMMSLAVHDFFKDKRADFYYVPIGKNEYYNRKQDWRESTRTRAYNISRVIFSAQGYFVCSLKYRNRRKTCRLG